MRVCKFICVYMDGDCFVLLIRELWSNIFEGISRDLALFRYNPIQEEPAKSNSKLRKY